jgi:hypothetical protein
MPFAVAACKHFFAALQQIDFGRAELLQIYNTRVGGFAALLSMWITGITWTDNAAICSNASLFDICGGLDPPARE